MKVFAMNERGFLMPNFWCIYSVSLNSDIISLSDQLVSFFVMIENQKLC